MTNRNIGFLVAPTASAPKSLPEAIRQVGNLSAGFCRSWLSGDKSNALLTSEDAFQLFDHIQNEILRHRDVKAKLTTWTNDPFKAALDAIVGEIIDPASPEHKVFFQSQSLSLGTLPSGTCPAQLNLATALNKLKHRSTSDVNFTAAASGDHVLYIFTNGGMGKQDTICSFDVQVFCAACKVAAQAI
jgi:hypothetical protein